MAKVSIIVPNYNHAVFLPKRMESIFNQTYRDIEIILLDDHSTDNSIEILKQYVEHTLVSQLVVNEQNSGSPFRQWKKGIELSKGEYIWIAESDDWAELNFLEELIPKLESGADLVYCRSIKVDEQNQEVYETYWPDSKYQDRWSSDYVNNGIDEISHYLAYRCPITNASSCVFRKREGLFTEDILNSRFTGDWLFWVNYLKDTKLAYVAKPLNYHRSHPENTRSKQDIESNLIRLEERMRAIKEARSICGMKSVRFQEIRKYNYLLGSLSRIKKRTGFQALLKSVPLKMLIYTYLYDLNMVRHNILKKIISYS